jgi:hypothetical protein
MKTNLVLFFLTLASLAQAQFTYITDRRFFEPADLVGYDFKPFMKEIPNDRKEEFDAGTYSFGITFNNLYVKGPGIEGVYNINNMTPDEYGFKLLLMNARDARLQGHLKVILNKYSMVEALIFKRSPNEKELIFYLSAIPGKLKEMEQTYFTDRGELAIESPDSIWGKSFRPFLRIHTDARVQERLRLGDSTSISFMKTITIEEKDKKKKKLKDETVAEAAADTLQITLGETVQADTTGLANDPDKKVKIIEEYFVVVRSIIQFEDGMREDKTWKYPVKRISEKEDKAAGQMEERYQWEFITDDKEKIVLYLNGDHTVSSMHIGPKTYLMRGF